MVENNKKMKKEDPEEVIEAAIYQTESFIERNGKKLLIVLGACILFVSLFFGIKYLVVEPREETASAMMFEAEQMFAADSFAVALNEDKVFQGFLSIIDQYGSTRTGNIAKHYAGVCYLKLSDYNNAIEYLGKYSDVDGIASEIINAQNKGLIGDAKAQLNDLDGAVSMYEKAVSLSNNILTAPYYLKKAGIVYMQLKNNKKAVELFEKIKTDYPSSYQARDISKYIGAISE